MADSSDIIAKIRRTCRDAVENSPHVSIALDAVEPFVREVLLKTPAEHLVPPFNLPLVFESIDDEINLWTLLQIINFGSGFRHELHEHTGAGAWDTMVRGTLSMHLMGRKVNAEFMSSVDKAEIVDLFGTPADVEVQIMPAVYQHKPGPLAPLVDMLVKVINEAGNALQNRKFDSFAHFFRSKAGAGRPKVADFVQLLVDTFPGFRDITTVRGKEVFVCKKAQLCAAYMYRKFGKTVPEVFDFVDIERLTVMADNVLPAVLRAVGILKYSEDIAAAVDSKTSIPAGEIDTDLRAASVVAGEEVTKATRTIAQSLLTTPEAASAYDIKLLEKLSQFTEADLDEFLWTHGKEPHMRCLQRHATRDTYFY